MSLSRLPMVLLAVLLAAGEGRAAAASPDATSRQLATILQQQALDGIVWATLTPQGVRTGSAGLAAVDGAVPMTPAHRVQIGSVTKTVLALGVLRLVTQGRLALEQPVAALLPGLHIDNPWAASHPLRLRHLLDHTGGLDDARLSQILSLRTSPDAPLATAFARQDGRLRLRTRPGSRMSYSNSGYALLGMVIEAVTGQRYEAALHAQLLAPLGLADSSFGFVTQRGPQADARLAMGHAERGLAQPALPMPLRPAGQFTTTAADMARLAAFLMGDGRLDGAVFVDPALLRAMGRPAHTDAALAGLDAGYALGLATRDRHGVLARCHGGNIAGYAAMLCLQPESQRAFFYAINTDNDDADLRPIERALVEAAGFAPPADAARTPAAAADHAAWAGWYQPSPGRFETLALVDALTGTVRLTADERGLVLHAAGRPALALQPQGGSLYRAEGRVRASHALWRDERGEVLLGTGQQTFERGSPLRLGALWLGAGTAVAGFAWLLLRAAAWLLQRLRRRPGAAAWLPAPLAGVFGLLLPLPLFAGQSFFALGDPTPASVLLGAASVMLPPALLLGLWRWWRAPRRPRGAAAVVDALAMLALLQGCVLLAAWGLWPLRLWA